MGPPAKRLLASDQIKSTFVKTIVDGAKKKMEQEMAPADR
jgi:hypothetical protein